MLIAHLTDLHVFADAPESGNVRPDIADVARALIADVAQVAPDAVLITGDLTDGGSAADYALLRDMLAPLRMPPLAIPVLAIPGNHDRRDTMRTAFADLTPFAPGDHLNFATRLGDVQIIGLDTTIPGRVEGMLCDARLTFLRENLGPGPAFVMLHHPPFLTGNTAWDAISLQQGQAELAAILRAAKGPVQVLCGHVHHPMHMVWNGAGAATGGSPAFQYRLGIDGTDDPPLSSEPYAYALHHLRADGSIGVHRRIPGA